MGVTLSTQSSLAPISLASTIIGFISFSFTIATFLRVFWENIMTTFMASDEIHDYLTNLRVQLYEERQSLKNLRRHNKDSGRKRQKAPQRPRLDDLTIKSMQETVRHLTRRFRSLERPFLNKDSIDDRRRNRKSPSSDPRSWDSEKYPRNRDQEWDKDLEEEEDPRIHADEYCTISLGKRILWLRRRSEAMALLEAFSRLQTRRVARQVGEIAIALHEYGDVIEEMRETVKDVEARLNSFVGVRRIN